MPQLSEFAGGCFSSGAGERHQQRAKSPRAARGERKFHYSCYLPAREKKPKQTGFSRKSPISRSVKLLLQLGTVRSWVPTALGRLSGCRGSCAGHHPQAKREGGKAARAVGPSRKVFLTFQVGGFFVVVFPGPAPGPPCSRAGCDGSLWIAPKKHIPHHHPPTAFAVLCGPGLVTNATTVSPSVITLLPPLLVYQGTLPGPGDPGSPPNLFCTWSSQRSPCPQAVSFGDNAACQAHVRELGLGLEKGGRTWGHPRSGMGHPLPPFPPDICVPILH